MNGIPNAVLEMAWAMEARSAGEPICRDTQPEPYFLDMARAAYDAITIVRMQLVERAFALEAADELERLGNISKSMAGAAPAIIAEEDRLQQQRELYEADAGRWFRLARSVRQIAGDDL